jgi:hypothetical protein
LEDLLIKKIDELNQVIKIEGENINNNTNKNFEEAKMRTSRCTKCPELMVQIEKMKKDH